MARVGVQIVGDASSLVKAFNRAGTAGRRFGNDMSRTNRAARSTASLFAPAAALTVGITGVAAGLVSVAKAAMGAQKVQAQLRAQLKASGISYGINADQIERVVAKQSQLAAVDDELVKGSLTTLIRSTGDLSKAYRLNAIALDVAAAKHISLESAAKLVAKVQAGNISAFSRYGVVVKKGSTVTEALAAVQKKFAGQAKASGSGAEGAFKRFGVAIDNLKEAFGAGLLPVLTRVANVLSAKLADPRVQKRIEEIGRAVGEKLLAAVEGISNWVSAHGDDLRAVWGFVGAAIKAGATAAKALVGALKAVTSIVPSDKLLLMLGILYGANKVGLPVVGRRGGGGKKGGGRGVPGVLPLPFPLQAAAAVAVGGIMSGKSEDAANRAKFQALTRAQQRQALEKVGKGNAKSFFGVSGEEYAAIMSKPIGQKIAGWRKMGASFSQDMSGTIRAVGPGGQTWHTFAPGSAGYGQAQQIVINVNGAGDPDAVAQRVAGVLQRNAKQQPAQQRGRTGTNKLGLG